MPDMEILPLPKVFYRLEDPFQGFRGFEFTDVEKLFHGGQETASMDRMTSSTSGPST